MIGKVGQYLGQVDANIPQALTELDREITRNYQRNPAQASKLGATNKDGDLNKDLKNEHEAIARIKEDFHEKFRDLNFKEALQAFSALTYQAAKPTKSEFTGLDVYRIDTSNYANLQTVRDFQEKLVGFLGDETTKAAVSKPRLAAVDQQLGREVPAGFFDGIRNTISRTGETTRSTLEQLEIDVQSQIKQQSRGQQKEKGGIDIGDFF